MTMTRLCRSQWAEVLIAALALGGGATLRAQQAAPSSQVALIFDDQKVHDGERATLFDLIVELVPVEKWQSVKVTQATDLETIVYHYYYYFSSGEYQAPLTVNALVRAIRRANTLKEGPVPANTEIRIPPIPMRAFGRFDYPRQLRVFTPEAQGYAVSQNATAVAVPTRARLPAAQSQAAVPLRRASSTAIIVDVSAKDIERIGPEALPTNVVALSATATGGTATTAPKVTLGLVPVEFLSAARDECPNPFDALDTSPFRQAQVTRVARVVGADEPQLLEAATRRPLVIMDIGFGSHHGQKVKSVADQVLEKLGAPESLRRKMVPVEMYPVDAAAKANLTSLRRRFRTRKRGSRNRHNRWRSPDHAWTFPRC